GFAPPVGSAALSPWATWPSRGNRLRGLDPPAPAALGGDRRRLRRPEHGPSPTLTSRGVVATAAPGDDPEHRPTERVDSPAPRRRQGAGDTPRVNPTWCQVYCSASPRRLERPSRPRRPHGAGRLRRCLGRRGRDVVRDGRLRPDP